MAKKSAAKKALPQFPTPPILGQFESSLVVRIKYPSLGRGRGATKSSTQVYIIPASALQTFALLNPLTVNDPDSPLARQLDSFFQKYYKNPPVDAAYVGHPHV